MVEHGGELDALLPEPAPPSSGHLNRMPTSAAMEGTLNLSGNLAKSQGNPKPQTPQFQKINCKQRGILDCFGSRVDDTILAVRGFGFGSCRTGYSALKGPESTVIWFLIWNDKA